LNVLHTHNDDKNFCVETHRSYTKKTGFVDVFKNLVRYRSENNFVGPSK